MKCPHASYWREITNQATLSDELTLNLWVLLLGKNGRIDMESITSHLLDVISNVFVSINVFIFPG